MSRETQKTDAPPQSNTEAIRRAIAALGPTAQVPQILDYVREHFGIGGSAGILLPDSSPGRPAAERATPSFAAPAAARSAPPAPPAPPATPPAQAARAPQAEEPELIHDEAPETPAGKKVPTRRKAREHRSEE